METKPNDPINFIPEAEKDRFYTNENNIFSGLTKREHFAVMAMQGLLKEYYHEPDYAATRAVECADALINALNETK